MTDGRVEHADVPPHIREKIRQENPEMRVETASRLWLNPMWRRDEKTALEEQYRRRFSEIHASVQSSQPDPEMAFGIATAQMELELNEQMATARELERAATGEGAAIINYLEAKGLGCRGGEFGAQEMGKVLQLQEIASNIYFAELGVNHFLQMIRQLYSPTINKETKK